MSFLESIQHGLEKATQEATRITKIQHLHNVANDLTFRVTQEEQALVGKAMELYQHGSLSQAELLAICQQVATYQQQINEVHEEIQRLQNSQEDGAQVPPPPTAYPAYPPAPTPQAYAPGTIAPAYPPYAAPPTGYPAYAPPAAYPPTYPASPSGEPPTSPGAPAAEIEQPLPSSEIPTRPGARKPETQPELQSEVISVEPPVKPEHEVKHHHKTSEASAKPAQEVVQTTQETEAPAASEASLTKAPGSYEDGVLPPIFSPFAAKPVPQENPAEVEPEKPARAHHKKDTAESAENASTEASAKEKKSHKATETQA